MASHAMNVSRELGIPCVAGIAGIASAIPDATLVEVDGGAGTVTIVDIAASEPEATDRA